MRPWRLLLVLLSFGGSQVVNTAEAAETRPPTATASFASRLPPETEAFLGSHQGRNHLRDFAQSAYGRQLSLFLQEQPIQRKRGALVDWLTNPPFEDVFFACGPGSAAHFANLKTLSQLYTELTYAHVLNSGTPDLSGHFMIGLLGATSAMPAWEPFCKTLENLTVPSWMIGFQTADPDQLRRQWLPPEALPPWLKTATPKSYTPTTGGHFTTYTNSLDAWLNAFGLPQPLDTLAYFLPDAAARQRLQTVLQKLALLEISLTIGVWENHLIFALHAPHQPPTFATSPAQSLAAQAKFTPPAGSKDAKNPLLTLFASTSIQETLHSVQPRLPQLRGILHGLASKYPQEDWQSEIAPKLEALTHAEKAYHHQTFTSLRGGVWWQKGLHAEFVGGSNWHAAEGQRRFASLLDRPGAFFTLIGRKSETDEGTRYFESFFALLYVAAEKLANATLGRDQLQQLKPMIEQAVLPPILQGYQALRNLERDALGREYAWVADLQFPSPSASETSPSDKSGLPRLALVRELKQPHQLQPNWENIENALTLILENHQQQAPAPKHASTKDGLTTWLYPLSFSGTDFSSFASVSDSLVILSNSPSLNETLAAQARQTVPPLSGTHLRLRFDALKNWMRTQTTSSFAPALPWLTPFHDLSLSWQQEHDEPRFTMDWDIHESKGFD